MEAISEGVPKEIPEITSEETLDKIPLGISGRTPGRIPKETSTKFLNKHLEESQKNSLMNSWKNPGNLPEKKKTRMKFLRET